MYTACLQFFRNSAALLRKNIIVFRAHRRICKKKVDESPKESIHHKSYQTEKYYATSLDFDRRLANEALSSASAMPIPLRSLRALQIVLQLNFFNLPR